MTKVAVDSVVWKLFRLFCLTQAFHYFRTQVTDIQIANKHLFIALKLNVQVESTSTTNCLPNQQSIVTFKEQLWTALGKKLPTVVCFVLKNKRLIRNNILTNVKLINSPSFHFEVFQIALIAFEKHQNETQAMNPKSSLNSWYCLY